MSVQVQALFAPTQLTTAAAAYYTAQATTRIDKLTVSNPSASTTYSVQVFLVPQSGTVGDDNCVLPATDVLPKTSIDVWQAMGQVLPVGASIQALASANTALTLFGAGLTVS